MATRNIGAVRALMEMASRKYVQDTAKGERANAKFNKNAKKGFRASNKATGLFTSGMKRMLGAVVAAAGVKGLQLLVKSSLATADAIAKTADKVGFGTDALQEIRFAAKQSGVEFSATDIALQRFSRRIGEAAQGQGVLFKTLTDNNIRLRDQNNRLRSSSDILDDYADLIGSADDQQKKLLLTFQAFDTEGAALVNLLGKGSGALKKLRQEARDAGIVLDEQLLRGAEGANDALTKMSLILKGQLDKKILELAPAIEKLATQFIDGLPGMLDFAQEFAEFIGLIDDADGVPKAAEDAGKLALEMTEVADALAKAKDKQDKLFVRDLDGKIIDTSTVIEDQTVVVNNLQVQYDDLLIRLMKLKKGNEEVAKTEEELTKSFIDNTDGVHTNTEALILSQNQMAIYANKSLPDISDALDATSRRMEKLRNELDKDPFEAAKTGAQEFAEILGAVNDIASELAAGAIRRVEENEQREVQSSEAARVRRDEEIEAQAIIDQQQALSAIEDADILATRLIQIDNKKNQALSSSERAFENESIRIRQKAANEEADIRRAQKPFMIAEAIANTAVAVTEQLANPPLAALIAIAGAAQVANIMAAEFAVGGSGMVTGSGGTDSQFVPIMATPGEKITVQTPGQQRAGVFPGSGMMGGGREGAVLFNLNVTFEGNVSGDQYVDDVVIPRIEERVRASATEILSQRSFKVGNNLGGAMLRPGKG